MEATKYNKSEIMKKAHRNYVVLGDSRKNCENNKRGRKLFPLASALRWHGTRHAARFPRHATRKPKEKNVKKWKKSGATTRQRLLFMMPAYKLR